MTGQCRIRALQKRSGLRYCPFLYVMKWLAFNQIQPLGIAKNVEKSTLLGLGTGVRIPYAPFPKNVEIPTFFGIFYALSGGEKSVEIGGLITF